MKYEFRIKEREDQPNPKTIFPMSLEIIKYSFTIVEIDEKQIEIEGEKVLKTIEHETNYFEFEDFNSIPGDRGFNCLSYYNELSQRCTRDYLIAFSTAFDNIMNDNKSGIKITKLMELNQQLKERLEFLIEPEIAYKLCSIVFFDETENPYRFSYTHSAKNAEMFKKAPIGDFFFSQPIVKLVPYINGFAADFPEYCQMVNLMTKEHLKGISQMLSEQDKNREFFNSILSQLVQDLL